MLFIFCLVKRVIFCLRDTQIVDCSFFAAVLNMVKPVFNWVYRRAVMIGQMKIYEHFKQWEMLYNFLTETTTSTQSETPVFAFLVNM